MTIKEIFEQLSKETLRCPECQNGRFRVVYSHDVDDSIVYGVGCSTNRDPFDIDITDLYCDECGFFMYIRPLLLEEFYQVFHDEDYTLHQMYHALEFMAKIAKEKKAELEMMSFFDKE